MRLLKLFAVVATLTGAAAASAQADSSAWGPETATRNLQAVLRPAAGGPATGLGIVSFRQPKDAKKIVLLDVRVRGLVPNQSYLLQRATDTSVDDDCTGTNWLTLGRGLDPRAIQTNNSAAGRAKLSRDLATVPTGTQLDIHFRVIDAVTSAVVLESFCYQFTVSQ
jgi:hypothetical protein